MSSLHSRFLQSWGRCPFQPEFARRHCSSRPSSHAAKKTSGPTRSHAHMRFCPDCGTSKRPRPTDPLRSLRCGGVRVLTLEGLLPTSHTDVLPCVDLACVALQSLYQLSRLGLAVKEPAGDMALWWQSAPFLLPKPLRHPEHVDEERMSATCPYYLAEVAQFNWLSQVDWMSGVPADERHRSTEGTFVATPTPQ
eukprot:2286572-Pleurochrysis_carterae.AAC.2